MSYDEFDAQQDAFYEQMQKEFEEGLKQQAKDAVKCYLARYGDAVDGRVQGSLKEAAALLADGYPGPAICAVAIAIELMIRFMLVRPLIQGAFLSDEWADILTNRIVSGRPGDDQKLVPAVLKQWGVDVLAIKGPISGVAVWDFTVKTLFPARHKYVHRFEAVATPTAAQALECGRAFRDQVVNAVAQQMGFTLPATGKWCEILHPAKVQNGFTVSSAWTEQFLAEVPAALCGK